MPEESVVVISETPKVETPPAPLIQNLSPTDLALFAELLAGLVRARMPLPDALKLLGRSAENARLRKAFSAMENEVAAGVSLPEAMRKHPAQFPDLFVQIVDQGCAANDLHAVLLELVHEYRSQARFREALWNQMLSPMITAFSFVLLVLLIVGMNVPEAMAGLFQTMRIDVPWSTRVLVTISDFIKRPWSPVFIAPIFFVGALILWRLSCNERVRCFVQVQSMKLPIIGPYLRTLTLGRFCRLTTILLRRKIPLHACIDMASRSASFVPMKRATEALAVKIANGEALSSAIANDSMFPSTFAHLLTGVELNGNLPDSFHRLAEIYEDRLNVEGTRLRVAIYVLATVILGACVTAMVGFTMWPIFNIQEVLRRK